MVARAATASSHQWRRRLFAANHATRSHTTWPRYLCTRPVFQPPLPAAPIERAISRRKATILARFSRAFPPVHDLVAWSFHPTSVPWKGRRLRPPLPELVSRGTIMPESMPDTSAPRDGARPSRSPPSALCPGNAACSMAAGCCHPGNVATKKAGPGAGLHGEKGNGTNAATRPCQAPPARRDERAAWLPAWRRRRRNQRMGRVGPGHFRWSTGRRRRPRSAGGAPGRR